MQNLEIKMLIFKGFHCKYFDTEWLKPEMSKLAKIAEIRIRKRVLARPIQF